MGVHYGVRPSNNNVNSSHDFFGTLAYYDVGNNLCYPGSGTSIFDLSGGSYHGTLTNGPTYNSSYGGSIVFDGSNDSILTLYPTTLTTISNNFSYEVWLLPTASASLPAQATSGTSLTSGNRWVLNSDQRGTARGIGLSVGNNGICVVEHGSGAIYPTLSHAYTFSSTLFTHLVITVSAGTASLYINGTFIKTGVNSARTVYPCFNIIGSGSYGIYAGRIAFIKLFNYVLTAGNILTNYNNRKSRFGL
jgi:hypothetical protein